MTKRTFMPLAVAACLWGAAALAQDTSFDGAPSAARPPSAADFVTRELRAYFLDQGTTWLGAAELVVSQAAYWATSGILLGISEGNPRAGPAELVIGGLLGGGLASAYVAGSGGVTAGQVSLINAATSWASWIGLLTLLSQSQRPQPGVPLGVAIAPVAASVLGATAWGLGLKPTSGQVQLTSTFGMYAAGIGAMIFFGAVGLPVEQLFPVVLGTAFVGLASGAYLSWRLRPSRLWAMAVSTVGAVTALTSVGVMALLRIGPNATPEGRIPFFVIPSAITAAAMASAILLPLRWKETLGEVLVTPSATREGGGLMLIGRF